MNRRLFPTRPLAFVLLLLCGAVQAAGKSQVTLNLKDADIGTLITTVSEVTGKNFIVDPRVKGKVTVVSSSPMNAAAIYQTFLSVLQVQGFAAVPSGPVIKILPEANARTEGGGYVATSPGLAGDEIVTHVYELQNSSAVQIVNVMRPLVAQSGQLAAYAPGNMLIISDRAANIDRVERLVRQIDSAGERELELVPLKNAIADDVVRTLSAVQQQDRQTDPTAHVATVLADERSNSIIVAGDRSDRQKIKDVIQQLDLPLKEDGYTQVIFLRYATAENLAPILQGYAQQSTRSSSRSSSPSSGSSFGGGFGSSSSLNSNNSTSAAVPTPTLSSSSSGGGSSGGSSNIFDRTTIVADKDTNALVVTAPPQTMKMLRRVIAQLDIQRKQVLVDAIIAEVSANRSSELGIDWIAYNPKSVAAAGILNQSTLSAIQSAGTALGSSSSSSNSNSALIGAAASLLGQGATAAAGTITSGGAVYAALLKALRSDGDSNILSTPSEMVLDNEEAKISVGQEVPFLTGQFSNTGVSSSNGSVNPFQTIDRKDVGLSLGVTPTITAGETIMLRIQLENSSLSSGAAGAANLITNKRTINTSVSVDDGQILVLGGLIDDQLNDSQSRIPVLGDVPLIGSLFRSHSVQKTKRNLMVFIHPTILSRPSEGEYFTRLKYDGVRNAQIGTSKGAVPLIGGQRPLLYDYDDFLKRNSRPQPAPPATPDGAAAAGTDQDGASAAGTPPPN